eukprot:3154226-Rhodomonas_salina.1
MQSCALVPRTYMAATWAEKVTWLALAPALTSTRSKKPGGSPECARRRSARACRRGVKGPRARAPRTRRAPSRCRTPVEQRDRHTNVKALVVDITKARGQTGRGCVKPDTPRRLVLAATHTHTLATS